MAEGGREGNMEVGDGGISNTVEVRGFSKKTSQELMEMYFENSLRSGGGDVEEVMISDEIAYITFKEAEVAQRVASQNNHQVDGHTLTVTLFHPKPCYQNRVLIQGPNNAITEELLSNFLERKRKAQVTEFLYGEEDGNVVVTFSDNIDIVQLGKIFKETSVEGIFLKVKPVEISNCILVQNLQPSSSHDAILYYFENKKRSGGGDVERVEMKTEERYCLIYFEDSSVIDRVLGQSHNMDGVDFEIHLHHECLGRRSSRRKSDLHLRMSSPGSKDNASLEDDNTDNQEKEMTSSSVSSNPEKESDFVEVQEWQENDDNASLEDDNTDNQEKEMTSSSVSSNPEKESDFVEVQEWQENDDNATLENENTDNQVKEKTSSSVSSNPEKESDFVEVQEWQENDGKNCTLPLWIKYKRAPDMKIIRCIKNIPCSWNFHLYWNFFTKTEPGKQMLHEILNKYNFSVSVFDEDEDLFIFEISEKIFEQASDVVDLIHVVLDSVHKFAQQFLYLDNILVDQRIQGDVLQEVKQRKELNIARLELMGEEDFAALYVICTEKDQALVLRVVTEIIHKVTKCFENHEETIQVDHKWQKVMKTFGYLQKLCEKYPNVTISDKTEAAILLKGPRDQLKPAADLFFELLGTASSEVQEEMFSPGCQFEIFTFPEMCGYIDNITMELSIVWMPNHQTKKIHLFFKKSEKIKGVDKFIKGCIKERLYPLAKDQTFFSTKMIRSLEELKKMHTGKMVFSSSDKGLLLTATDDIFESIDDAVQEIICKETVFPCQWDKFEVRFETEDHSLSKGYIIKEVSPITMQYIADNRDEKDSLIKRFKRINLKGMLESGLLKIYLQEDKMKEDYLSEVENKVITTLRSHIETPPAIQTKQLTQVVIENIQQVQELGHLECLRSNRVKIYICNSGRGVFVVGREVGKDVVESICRAYGETSKKNAVCCIPESVGVNTENAAESLKQFEKESVENTESETRVTLDRSTIQLLIDSDFVRKLCKQLPKVSIILLSSEVIFKGPHEVLSKAECYIEWHLKSKGYWHEVEQAASLIETSKRLNFEAYLKGKIPDVHVVFSDGKIIFIGKENMVNACEGELAIFYSTINRHCIALKSIFISYLKMHDVQNYIWEKFNSGHIECYWKVIQNGIEFIYSNVEHLSAAKSVLSGSAEAETASFKSVIDLQEFESSPDVKNLIHENKGRLYKEIQGNVLTYVGMPEVIVQIKKLHRRYNADRKNRPQGHSSVLLLSNILLAYVKKYLMKNIRKKFDVNVLELSDLSGIKITGAEDHVNNAVTEVKKILDQKQVFIYSLEISKMKTISRQIKEHVDTVEAENMTCVEIVSIPIKGKDTLTVSVGKALDVCLVYGSAPESVIMQIIPVNDSFYPVCLAATDIMKN
ncbi:hypothetical protein ACJMK2_006890, partial [Sinanodonta woodiana]